MASTLGWAHDVVSREPRVRLHLRRPAAEVRGRRGRRDRARPRWLLGAHRVLVVTDAGVLATGWPDRVADGIRGFGVEAVVHDSAHVEPTDASLLAAVERARADGPFDGYVAVGGGSAIDTAKAVDLLLSDGGELMDYVNAPVGAGRAPSRPLAPARRRADDDRDRRREHDDLRPRRALAQGQDRASATCGSDRASPWSTRGSRPRSPRASRRAPAWTSCATPSRAGRPGRSRLRAQAARASACPTAAATRSPTCGPSGRCRCWPRRSGRRFATVPTRPPAATWRSRRRSPASVSATRACTCRTPTRTPIAGRVRDFHPEGYPSDEPMVPHGMAVALTAPEAFRWTFESDPERHLAAARLLDPAHGGRWESEPRDVLPGVLVDLMRDIGMPNGLRAVGYDERDVDALVEGSLKQQRLLATSPREVGRRRPRRHHDPLAAALGIAVDAGGGRRHTVPSVTTEPTHLPLPLEQRLARLGRRPRRAAARAGAVPRRGTAQRPAEAAARGAPGLERRADRRCPTPPPSGRSSRRSTPTRRSASAPSPWPSRCRSSTPTSASTPSCMPSSPVSTRAASTPTRRACSSARCATSAVRVSTATRRRATASGR